MSLSSRALRLQGQAQCSHDCFLSFRCRQIIKGSGICLPSEIVLRSAVQCCQGNPGGRFGSQRKVDPSRLTALLSLECPTYSRFRVETFSCLCSQALLRSLITYVSIKSHSCGTPWTMQIHLGRRERWCRSRNGAASSAPDTSTLW